jgi:hypothetical protein
MPSPTWSETRDCLLLAVQAAAQATSLNGDQLLALVSAAGYCEDKAKGCTDEDLWQHMHGMEGGLS